MGKYNVSFFRDHQTGALRSARRIVPLLIDLINPRSVVDVGCGSGAWLSVFLDKGIDDVLGIDGDYVDRSVMLIPPDYFRAADLTEPLNVGRAFDLALSLEVGEHLPPSAADTLVDTLVSLAPAIAFSAAIPFQGGVNHVNEQWPDYWAGRFSNRGYVAVDCLRKRVWMAEDVEWWYSQNIMLYIKKSFVKNYAFNDKSDIDCDTRPLSLVHFKKYLQDRNSGKAIILATKQVATHIPSGASFLSIDDGSLGGIGVVGRLAIPFGQPEGLYADLPPDDETAILIWEKQRAAGSNYAVIYSTAFWWWEQLIQLQRHIYGNYRCIFQNDLVIIFDLASNVEID